MKKYFSLENLIYLAVFLLPTYLVKVKIFILPTNLLEIIIGAVFVLWVLRRSREIEWKIILIRYRKYVLSLGLIFSGLFVSAFFNCFPSHSTDYINSCGAGAGIIKSWFFVPLIFMLISADVIKKEKIKNIFFAFYFSAAAVAAISLFFLFFGKLTYDGRLESFFNSPNYLAMYLCPGIIIGLFAFSLFRDKNNLKKYSFISSFFIILTALYFTYSYAAWISTGLAIMAVFLAQYRISLKKMGLVGIIFVFLVFSQLKNEKLNDLAALDPRSSMVSRVAIWAAAGRMLENHWMLGIGPGNFERTYLVYQKYFPPYLEWAVPHPHNLFLSFWLSGGILALIGFLSLLFFWFQDIFFRKNKAFVEWVALGIIVYILLHGLVDTTYFKNDLAIIFWLSFLALKK